MKHLARASSFCVTGPPSIGVPDGPRCRQFQKTDELVRADPENQMDFSDSRENEDGVRSYAAG
jgi:hypothetical protein